MINKLFAFFCFLFLLFPFLSFSQNIKFGGGVGISKVTTSGAPVLDKNINILSFFLGLDALENEKFCLSNEVGFLQLGGKETNPALPEPNKEIEKKWNYIYLSSAFRYKLFPNTSSSFFVGAGPKFNFLISSNGFKNTLYENAYEMKKLNFGINTEFGYLHNWSRYQFGIVGSYLVSLSPIAENNFNKLKSNPLSANLSFGINFK